MNKQLLEKYNISFYKNSNKESYILINDVISSYLYIWRNIEDIDDFLVDIELCLRGQISVVADTDYSDGLLNLYGTLKPDELIISDERGLNWVAVPLLDFKELLVSWREFILSK